MNNKSKYFRQWSNKKLLNEYEGLKQSIELTGWSSKDMHNLESIKIEMERRGL